MIRMALDCYVDPKRQGWVDIGDEWDVETEIGWLEAGLRGYIFSSEDNKTVVIGIKGTSLKLFGTGGGPTGNNDKLNVKIFCQTKTITQYPNRCLDQTRKREQNERT